jgi:multiple sugar transport system substrate-binding protein
MKSKLLLTALLALAPAAFAPPALAADGIALRMAVWTGNAKHLALLNGIADAYKAAHPEIASITFDTIPYDNYTTTLTTQIAGGNAPDLAWILEAAAPDFVGSGALLALDDTLSSTPGYDFADLSPSATALWKADGKLYAYPFSTSPYAMFANLDLLAAAGQKTPAELIAADKWNWTVVAEEAAAVHAKTQKNGVEIRDFDYKDWTLLTNIWDAWGARPWSGDGKTCTLDTPDMASAMEFLHKAIFKDGAIPGPGTSGDFFAGDAAFSITQISRASLLKDGTFKWDLVPLPAGPVGAYSVIGQAGIGVFRNGKNPKDAAAFLAFLSNPDNSLKLAQFFPPPRLGQLNADTLGKTNPLLTKAQLENVVVKGITTGRVSPSHTNNAQIAQQIRASLDAAWTPDADLAAVLSGACAKIGPLLAH